MMLDIRNIQAERGKPPEQTTKNKSEAEPCMLKINPTTKALENDEKNSGCHKHSSSQKVQAAKARTKKNKADTEAMEHEHGQK